MRFWHPWLDVHFLSPEIWRPRDFVTNEEVWRRTNHLHLTSIMRRRRLGLFGHVARSDPANDTRRALAAPIVHLSGKDLPRGHGTLGYRLSQRK